MSKAIIAVKWTRMVKDWGEEERTEKDYGHSIHLDEPSAKQYIKEQMASTHNAHHIPGQSYLALVSDSDYHYLQRIWNNGKVGYRREDWMLDQGDEGDEDSHYLKILGTEDLSKMILEKINAESV